MVREGLIGVLAVDREPPAGGHCVRRVLHLPGRQPRKLARAPALGLRTRPRCRRQRGGAGVHGGERRSGRQRRRTLPGRSGQRPHLLERGDPGRRHAHRRERDPAGRGHRRGRGSVPQGGHPRFGHAVPLRHRRSRAERRQRDGRRDHRGLSGRRPAERSHPAHQCRLHDRGGLQHLLGLQLQLEWRSDPGRPRRPPDQGRLRADDERHGDRQRRHAHGPGGDPAPHGRHGQCPGSDERRRLRGGRGGHARVPGGISAGDRGLADASAVPGRSTSTRSTWTCWRGRCWTRRCSSSRASSDYAEPIP